MEHFFYGLLFGLCVAVIIGLVLPRKNCPKCDTLFPKFRFPDSFDQMMFGGWTCKQCGCRVDRTGKTIGDKRVIDIHE